MKKPVDLFLCGDFMPGRGIDQILPFPSEPVIHEPYVKNAIQYVNLAEELNGPVPRHVDFVYIWGNALEEFKKISPVVRIINLETSITKSNDYWNKGINYRMNPANIRCITVASIDCCCLANNHVLDWGYAGLAETLDKLHEAGVKTTGAGRNLEDAEAPAILTSEGKDRVLVFAFGSVTSGILQSWAAQPDKPGVNLLKDFSKDTIQHIEALVKKVKRKGDIVIFSIHWGGNWGYQIPSEQIQFAHELIDYAGVDVIHGHSSHHVKAIEVYNGKLILYGCGNFLDDYEGISGYESFRADLSLMYFPHLDMLTGKLISLRMTPMQIKRFKLNYAQKADARWLTDVLNREGTRFGSRFQLLHDNSFIFKGGTYLSLVNRRAYAHEKG